MRALETERLHLRPLDERDEALYCRIYTDAELMRHVGEPLTREAAQKAFIEVCRLNGEAKFRYRCWVVIHREIGEETGFLGLVGNSGQAEIGGMILPGWQGRSISAETFPAGIEVAFGEYKLDRINVRYRCSNGLADGLMRKLCFSKVPQALCENGWVRWTLDSQDWATRARRQAPTHPACVGNVELAHWVES